MALWVRHWDEASAHEYFVHTETGESRWEPPDEFEAAPAPDHAPASPLNAPAAAGDDDDYDEYDYDAPRGYDPPTGRRLRPRSLRTSAAWLGPDRGLDL